MVESAHYLPLGLDNWNPCDALIVAVWLFEKQFVLKESTSHATLDLTVANSTIDHVKELDKFHENVRLGQLVN